MATNNYLTDAVEKVYADFTNHQTWLALYGVLQENGFYDLSELLIRRVRLLDPFHEYPINKDRQIHHSQQRAFPQNILKMTENLLYAPKQTITAALIVKNEEQYIDQCLKSVIDVVDEVIVVDTGSSDKTVEIIESFPNVRLIKHEWNDDFSEARNRGLEECRTDWVIWLDADEELLKEDAIVLRDCTGMFSRVDRPVVLNLSSINHIDSVEIRHYDHPRLFPLKYGMKFFRRIHEQIGLSYESLYSPEIFRKNVNIRLLHKGYAPDVIADRHKNERNLCLIKKSLIEHPEDPFNHYHLGKAKLASGNYDEAINALIESYKLAQFNRYFIRKIEVLCLLAISYLKVGDYDKSIEMCNEALEIDVNYPDAYYIRSQARARQALDYSRSAIGHLNDAKQAFRDYRGAVTPDIRIQEWKADLVAAGACRLSGQMVEATRLYIKLLNTPAKETAEAQLREIFKQIYLSN